MEIAIAPDNRDKEVNNKSCLHAKLQFAQNAFKTLSVTYYTYIFGVVQTTLFVTELHREHYASGLDDA